MGGEGGEHGTTIRVQYKREGDFGGGEDLESHLFLASHSAAQSTPVWTLRDSQKGSPPKHGYVHL